MRRWLLPGLIAATGLVQAWVAAYPAWLEHGPVLCAFRLVTGIPCPGCGMTRAWASLALGDWASAWTYHPLALPFVGLVVVYALLAWAPEAWQARWRMLWRSPWWSGGLLSVVLAVWLVKMI